MCASAEQQQLAHMQAATTPTCGRAHCAQMGASALATCNTCRTNQQACQCTFKTHACSKNTHSCQKPRHKLKPPQALTTAPHTSNSSQHLSALDQNCVHKSPCVQATSISRLMHMLAMFRKAVSTALCFIMLLRTWPSYCAPWTPNS